MNDGLPTPDERGTSGMSMMMQSIDTEMLIWELGNMQAELVSVSERLKRIHSYLCERRRFTQSKGEEGQNHD